MALQHYHHVTTETSINIVVKYRLVLTSMLLRPKNHTITIEVPYFDHKKWLKDGRRMVKGWLNWLMKGGVMAKEEQGKIAAIIN